MVEIKCKEAVEVPKRKQNQLFTTRKNLKQKDTTLVALAIYEINMVFFEMVSNYKLRFFFPLV